MSNVITETEPEAQGDFGFGLTNWRWDTWVNDKELLSFDDEDLEWFGKNSFFVEIGGSLRRRETSSRNSTLATRS